MTHGRDQNQEQLDPLTPIREALRRVLYSCLRERRLTTGDLSRRLNIKEQEAAALVDPRSRPPIARLEQTLAVVGKRLVSDVRDAA